MKTMVCQKCGNRIRFGDKGKASLVCQLCGCFDFKLENPISLQPVLNEGGLGEKKDFKAEELISGKHSQGFLWVIDDVKVDKKLEKVEKEKVIEEEIKKDEIKEEEKKEIKKEEKEDAKIEPEKPTLSKAVKKLRLKINP